MAVETAHSLRPQGQRAHALDRGTQACLRAGVDVLFHCEYSDEETLDMFEEAKDRIFVAPTVSLFHSIVNDEAAANGLTREVGGYMGIPACSKLGQDAHRAAQARHPPRDRRRLRLRLEQAGHECARHRLLRPILRLHASRSAALRHAQRRLADDDGLRTKSSARSRKAISPTWSWSMAIRSLTRRSCSMPIVWS